jgi:hypothetical protein
MSEEIVKLHKLGLKGNFHEMNVIFELEQEKPF